MTKDEIIKAAASKLMGWKLPQDFCPDCYISFDSAKAKGMKSWPTGTNLFTREQAQKMFSDCLGDALDTALAEARLQGERSRDAEIEDATKHIDMNDALARWNIARACLAAQAQKGKDE